MQAAVPQSLTGVTNSVARRNIYGSAPGPTIGLLSTALTPYDTGNSMQSGNMTSDTGSGTAGVESVSETSRKAGGFFGQPVTWWLLLIVLLFAWKFVANKFGEGEESRTVKVTVYNVILIALAAIIGIGFFKVVFNRWQIPGLTDFVNAV